VKLGKNAIDTYAVLSEACGGEAMENSSAFEWHKRIKEGRMSKSQMNTILITSFDIKGIVHFEFISQDQRVNQAYYMEIRTLLREAVHRKRPEL
jgi:hypothetical protein